jgi:hypothetical protein
LGAFEKKQVGSEMGDIMKVTVPTKKIRFGKKDLAGLDEDEIKANNQYKEHVTFHYMAIYLEFMDYYDHFVSVQIQDRLRARFEPRDPEDPRNETRKQRAARSKRLLEPGTLDNYPALNALILERQELDAKFRDKGPLNLLLRDSWKLAEEVYPKIVANLNALRENTTQLDALLTELIDGYEANRDTFLLLMQSVDFCDNQKDQRSLAPWIADILRLDRLVRVGGAQNTAQVRSQLKNRLIVGYKLAPYYVKLNSVMNTLEPVKDAINVMHRRLIELLDARDAAGYERELREDMTQLRELVEKHPAAKEKDTKGKKTKKKSDKNDEKQKKDKREKGKKKKLNRDETKAKTKSWWYLAPSWSNISITARPISCELGQ